MTILTINIGSSANDGTGDQLRTAFDKVNDNFDELNDLIRENGTGDLILDSGSNYNQIIANNDSFTIANSKTPATAVGVSGDKQGMVAWDADYIYICTADYDGSTEIWRRSGLSTGW
jgi:hypothetical protein